MSQSNKASKRPSWSVRFVGLVGVIVVIMPLFVSRVEDEQQQTAATIRVTKPSREPIATQPPSTTESRPTNSVETPLTGIDQPSVQSSPAISSATTTNRPSASAATSQPTVTTSSPTLTESRTTPPPTTTPEISLSKQTSDSGGLNYCHSSTVPLPGDENKTVDIWFTCQGPLYDVYSRELVQNFAVNISTRQSTTWGRREHVFPSNSQTLVLGNGHSRQLAQVMLCQQSATARITSYRRIDKYVNSYTFSNNATLVMVTNTYASFATSDRWQELLERQIKRPLSEFSTVVLGLVDECNKDPTKRDNSFTTMMRTLDMEGIDCMTNDPPNLDDWMKAYNGPIVWVSPLTTARRSQTRDEFHRLQLAQRDRGLGFVYARQYLEGRDDCMALSRSEIADCQNQASSGNPCNGANGGLVDLIAWDVVEFLWTHNTTSPLTAKIPPRRAWEGIPAIRDDLTYCQSPVLRASRDPFSDETDIHYQCGGPLYDNLIEELYPFARDQSERRHPLQWWGRRNFGIPAHKRVLFYGNSHTRQVAKTLACQQMEMDRIKSVVSINATRVHQFQMVNNSSMVVVTNTFAPYSRAWLRLTEEDMGMKLSSFDVLVIGAFNNCEGDNAFSREMLRLSEVMPDVDCVNTPPPSLKEIAENFPGPIIYVTMFVKSANEQDHAVTRKEIQAIRAEQSRTNIHFVEARQYIDMTRDCRGQERFNVSDCWPRGGTGGPTHECTGPQGGHVDLIAWDVIEYLHRELEAS